MFYAQRESKELLAYEDSKKGEEERVQKKENTGEADN